MNIVSQSRPTKPVSIYLPILCLMSMALMSTQGQMPVEFLLAVIIKESLWNSMSDQWL